MTPLGIHNGLRVGPKHSRQRLLLKLEVWIRELEGVLVRQSGKNQLRDAVCIVSTRTNMSAAGEGTPGFMVVSAIWVTPALGVKVVRIFPVSGFALHGVSVHGYFDLFRSSG